MPIYYEFEINRGEVIYTHSDCSLNPDLEEPAWQRVRLLQPDSLPAAGTVCALCHRLLNDPPLYRWSVQRQKERNSA